MGRVLRTTDRRIQYRAMRFVEQPIHCGNAEVTPRFNGKRAAVDFAITDPGAMTRLIEKGGAIE